MSSKLPLTRRFGALGVLVLVQVRAAAPSSTPSRSSSMPMRPSVPARTAVKVIAPLADAALASEVSVAVSPARSDWKTPAPR